MVSFFEVCKQIVEGKPYKLVEAVAEKIAETILTNYQTVLDVTVKVIKPNPPIQGHYDSVAVEITRSRLKMENTAFIALGSNIGNRYDYLIRAIQLLKSESGYTNSKYFLDL